VVICPARNGQNVEVMVRKCEVSVIIPARNEPYLQKTINDVLEKAAGSLEVIVILDGYWPSPALAEDARVKIIHRGRAHGMRAAINAAAAVAQGNYLMKTDAHCLFGIGFDSILAQDCQDNCVMVPRRYRLDPEQWKIIEDSRPPVDYCYLNYELHGIDWKQRSQDPKYKDKLIDDLMSSQGSVWFMPKKLFSALELMDEKRWGTFYNEFQEIGLKAWLSGFSQVMLTKKTYYAHWYKGRVHGRGYHIPSKDKPQATQQVNKWFTFGKAWDKQKLPLSFLIDKFWPVPTWPEDRKLWSR